MPDKAIPRPTRSTGHWTQTLPRSSFEVVVVDDCSTDATPEVLAAEAQGGALDLRPIRRAAPGGAALARNDGWRAARRRLIAFTDDDCAPMPDWLEAGLSAWDEDADRFVQGMTTPAPDEMDAMGPSRIRTTSAGSLWRFTLSRRSAVCR